MYCIVLYFNVNFLSDLIYNQHMSNDLHLIENDFEQSTHLFNTERKKLQSMLEDFDVIIEHFGSTAVPHTIGKGIIDILVACNTEEEQELIRNILIENNYRQGELHKERDGRLFFCNVEGQTKAGDIHLHLVVKNTENHYGVLRLKQYLLTNPEEVTLYNQEKIRLATVSQNQRDIYVSSKREYMEQLIKRATA